MDVERPRIRMVAVDEDGTFVRPDNTFDRERFARIWDRMAELGIRFAVATGNQHHQVRQVFGPKYAPCIGIAAQDGTYVADGDEEVFVNDMDRALVAEVVATLRSMGLGVHLCGARAGYVEGISGGSDDPGVRLFDFIRMYYPRLQLTQDALAVDDRITMMATLVESEERAKEVAALIEERLDGRVVACSSGDGCVDILVPGSSKADGLRHLAERWGIDPSGVIAFGNAYNDLEMIEWAGIGVMMGNAPSDLKARAQMVAPPCSEDGVLAVLEQLFW